MQRAAAKSAAVAVAPQASAIQVGAACMPHAHSENAFGIAKYPLLQTHLAAKHLLRACLESWPWVSPRLEREAIETHMCVSGPRGRLLAEYTTEDSLHSAYLQKCRARLRKCGARLRKCRASGRCLGGSPAFAPALD